MQSFSFWLFACVYSSDNPAPQAIVAYIVHKLGSRHRFTDILEICSGDILRISEAEYDYHEESCPSPESIAKAQECANLIAQGLRCDYI